MSKESVIDISGPVDQASPQKVTTLPKRQRNAQFSGPVSPSNMTTVFPRSQAAVDEILASHTKANWHFTTPNARIKLRHLYPSI